MLTLKEVLQNKRKLSLIPQSESKLIKDFTKFNQNARKETVNKRALNYNGTSSLLKNDSVERFSKTKLDNFYQNENSSKGEQRV